MSLPTTLEVRQYLMDFPLLNLKYDDEIFSDDDIERATYWATERVASIPPFRSVTLAEVPKETMLNGILGQLFKMKYLNLSMNYAPGIIENGLNIREGELAPIYEKLFIQFDGAFQQEISDYKKAAGMVGSLSRIRSPYNTITRRDIQGNKAP